MNEKIREKTTHKTMNRIEIVSIKTILNLIDGSIEDTLMDRTMTLNNFNRNICMKCYK